jgi:alpha-amylase
MRGKVRGISTTYQLFVIGFAFLSGTAKAQPDNNLVYQVFVRSFATSKGPVGDLQGIRRQFSYIRDLNAGVLWLMPIFPTTTYHGYDIANYRSVNPEYGDLADLDALIKEAHGSGVRVILDIAFNHTSTAHPWFKQAVDNPSSPYRKFYFITDDDGTPLPARWHRIKNVRYLGEFSRTMPDLNLDNPALRQEIKSIAKFWLNRGIDGFRLDAANHIYDSDAQRTNRWWAEFSRFVYSINPRALLIGEVLGDAATARRYAPGLKRLLNDTFMRSTRAQIVTPKAGFLKQWAESSTGFDPFVFVASHDANPRLASFLDRKDKPGAYRLAMYLLLLIAKNPVLYNGDEVMQRGVKWDGQADGSHIYDETLREPFPWFASVVKPPQTTWFKPRYDSANDGVSVEEQNRKDGILPLVRALARFRKENPDFANADIVEIVEDSGRRMAFRKGKYSVVIDGAECRVTNSAGAVVFRDAAGTRAANRF